MGVETLYKQHKQCMEHDQHVDEAPIKSIMNAFQENLKRAFLRLQQMEGCTAHVFQ